MDEVRAEENNRFFIGETDEQLEYKEALKLWIQLAQFRRQGLLWVTAAEAGVLTANATSIAITNIPSWGLPGMGMFIAVVGLANEIFLFDEMIHFKRRAFTLEEKLRFSLLSSNKKTLNKFWLFATRNIFRFYFLVWFLAFGYQLIVQM